MIKFISELNDEKIHNSSETHQLYTILGVNTFQLLDNIASDLKREVYLLL